MRVLLASRHALFCVLDRLRHPVPKPVHPWVRAVVVSMACSMRVTLGGMVGAPCPERMGCRLHRPGELCCQDNLYFISLQIEGNAFQAVLAESFSQAVLAESFSQQRL